MQDDVISMKKEERSLVFQINAPVSAGDIADLRQAVGWNRMESCYGNRHMNSYFHIACYDKGMLIGYIDSVSNGVTDAYIQDLMVHPDYQGKGIGTELMHMMISQLKKNRIYMISVVFDEKLLPFYKRFGFELMLSGQMQTFDIR